MYVIARNKSCLLTYCVLFKKFPVNLAPFSYESLDNVAAYMSR